MNHLQLVYAPNPIFKQKAQAVGSVDDETRDLIDAMFATLYLERGIGLGANMVGVLKRIVVIDLQEDGKKTPMALVNPEIVSASDETQKYLEASLSFPGISADVTRPKAVTVNYLDYDGKPQTLEAEGYLATVVQHEIDYLDGKVFLDYVSRMKRDMLLKKMKKHMKLHPPHIHGPGCSH